MTYIAIASALNTILTTVKNATWSKLAQVYSYQIPNPESATGYPYASIINGEQNEEVLDSVDNLARYSFTIRVCNTSDNGSASETVMRGLCDDIMAELRKKTNLYLSNSVDNVLPFTIRWWWDTGNTAPIRYFEISIEAMKTHSTL